MVLYSGRSFYWLQYCEMTSNMLLPHGSLWLAWCSQHLDATRGLEACLAFQFCPPLRDCNRNFAEWGFLPNKDLLTGTSAFVVWDSLVLLLYWCFNGTRLWNKSPCLTTLSPFKLPVCRQVWERHYGFASQSLSLSLFLHYVEVCSFCCWFASGC